MEQELTLGKKLSTYRKNHDMTQQELAEHLNLSAQAISKWENDTSQPDIENLMKLAKLYGVSLDELLGMGSDKTEKPQTIDTDAVVDSMYTKIEEQIKNDAPIGYCKNCGIAVREENLAQKEPVIMCKKCKEKIEEEKRRKETAQRERQAAEKERAARAHQSGMESMRRHRNKSLIWAAIATLPILIFCIVGLFQGIETSDEWVGWVTLLVIDLLIFTFVAVMFYDTFVKDAVLYMLTASVNWPGIIFTFDLDGFIFLIAMKIIFAVLGFIIGILAALLGLLFGLLVSPFVLPFVLIRYNYKISHGIYEDPEW